MESYCKICLTIFVAEHNISERQLDQFLIAQNKIVKLDIFATNLSLATKIQA